MTFKNKINIELLKCMRRLLNFTLLIIVKKKFKIVCIIVECLFKRWYYISIKCRENRFWIAIYIIICMRGKIHKTWFTKINNKTVFENVKYNSILRDSIKIVTLSMANKSDVSDYHNFRVSPSRQRVSISYQENSIVSFIFHENILI